MPLSWNEIKSRAAGFSKEWSNTSREEAEAKPFLTDFLNIFGISRKRVATFEHRVKKLDDASGYIDLLWPGTLLVEMKSRGQDLKKAYEQARAYCHGLKDYELPQLILICDFQVFHIYREDGLFVEFELPDLINHLNVFEELAGYQKRSYHDEDPVNIAAAELMGKLHDELKAVGYTGAHLEVYLVRLVFILFADDSTIFQKGIFLDYLELRTREDGSDLAMHLDQLFQVLDTPEQSRLKTLDEQLNLFPYVNGRLFSERLPNAAFNTQMRQILLDCCKLDWAKISPAIFGSLFQSVMDATARRNLGAHYTSEKNILKVIKPLFVDDLWEEFHAAGENQNKLRALHHKISKLRFLDPACGCGNFLITAFRELRLVELAIAEKLLRGQSLININMFFMVDLDQFYGIEIGEFPSHIAQVAMWLIDHQMNMLVSEKFGEYIPLRSIASKISPLVDRVNDFSPGDAGMIFNIGAARIAPIICFELIDDQILHDAAKSSNLFVVQTNSATFGTSPESAQQLSITRVRAIEHSRNVLSVSTTGYSAVIDYKGKVVQQTSMATAEHLYASVGLIGQESVRDKLGDWASVGTFFWLLLVARRMRV